MGIVRGLLLRGSQSPWLREHAPGFWFVRRTATRFMPGETVDEALAAARQLQAHGIGTLLTYLGENISEAAEAERVTEHYLTVLDRIRTGGLHAELSVKLTQLGVDVSSSTCYANLTRIIERAGKASVVWIDMESSRHTDITLELYRRLRRVYSNVAVCAQAYLFRTAQDIAALRPYDPSIRLVKGAYKEAPKIALPRKKDVDENYFSLARTLLRESLRQTGARVAIATHDPRLIRRVTDLAAALGVKKDQYEFQMLYGIQRLELVRLVREGYQARVLIAYGAQWFPWFMRRLAERPANAWLLLRNLI
ncbi:MAG: proline dehydrogenase [Acidobacteria bacterium]|nr:MAG: proline dehydrogenase [Acidobacteriota bacterium]